MKLLTGLLFVSLLALPLASHAQQRAGSTSLQLSLLDVIPTGFQQGYPITFAYSADGALSAVFEPGENAQLLEFLKNSSNSGKLTAKQAQQGKKFEGLLELSGETVKTLNPGEIKLFTVAADPSIGKCPPCGKRDALIAPFLSESGAINYQYVTFVTR